MAPRDKGALPEYSWQEVAKHNSPASAWVIFKDAVYDITDFLDMHPGGKEMLLLAAGRDVTELVASYHPFTDKPEKYLTARQIGTVSNFEFPRFKPDSGFYKTVSARVGKYFADNNLNPKSPVAGLVRMVPVFATAAFCYAVMSHLAVKDASLLVRCLAAAVFGVCQVLPLLHIMHDASHTAIGNNESWWKAIGRFSLEWYAGASMMSWQHQHTIGHHLYTNLFGIDPDMPMAEKGDIRRLVQRQFWTKVYKYQHLYLPVLYGLLAIKFRIQDFTDTYMSRTNGAIRVNYYDNPMIRLYAVKVTWAIWRILLPLAVFGVGWKEFLLTFLIAELASGYWLAFNFQVSHVSTVAEYPNGIETKETSDEWAVIQVVTGVDYSHGNPIATFLSGALNYQVVHHLFPGVSQYHYPAIAPIIKKTCDEFKLRYRILPSFAKAFGLHIAHLKEMGDAGQAAHMD